GAGGGDESQTGERPGGERSEAADDRGGPRWESQPSSRTGENPPYGMIGRSRKRRHHSKPGPRLDPTRLPLPDGSHGKLHRTTEILSHAARRRGGVAARGARPAVRADAARRVLARTRPERSGSKDPRRCVSTRP